MSTTAIIPSKSVRLAETTVSAPISSLSYYYNYYDNALLVIITVSACLGSTSMCCNLANRRNAL